jgi:hypothetical protein
VERLDVCLRDDRLDVVHALDERRDPHPVVAAPGLEVLPHAGTQRLRLADVENVAALAAKEVDARLRRDPLQLLLHALAHAITVVGRRPLLRRIRSPACGVFRSFCSPFWLWPRLRTPAVRT